MFNLQLAATLRSKRRAFLQGGAGGDLGAQQRSDLWTAVAKRCSEPAMAGGADGLVVPSGSGLAQALAFSSGNPRIEETRGIMHLYPNDPSTSDLPAGRQPLVCVLGVPNHMTYADFCQFCASFIAHILEMRIVRNDGEVDCYSVLIRLDSQKSADTFFRHFDGRCFSSLEVDVCHVQFTVDIQYTGSVERAQTSISSSTEQPTCAVCLERFDQDVSGILTTICNHSFHCSCISRWTDSSCPVCRYCQQQPDKSPCSVCGTTENVCICLICGFVGCGRTGDGHAVMHWKETQHCFCVELETRRTWNHVGNNYVHRLIQSKTDGKLVELNSHCVHVDGDCGTCQCGADSGISDTQANSKVEATLEEYNVLLASEMEKQRKYYESLLQELTEESSKDISEAVEKAVNYKLQKLQAKLEKYIQEKQFLEDINENLLKNQEAWRTKIREIEEREKQDLSMREKKIRELEEQLQGLMVQLGGQSASKEQPPESEIKTAMAVPASADTLINNSTRNSRSKKKR